MSEEIELDRPLSPEQRKMVDSLLNAMRAQIDELEKHIGLIFQGMYPKLVVEFTSELIPDTVLTYSVGIDTVEE